MGFRYDFSGYATKNDIRCSDGRVIRKNAFKDNDGMTVPLVWQHQHDDPTNVLGHAILENRDDGVYVYGIFNDTDSARQAKALVEHGDVNSLSIYANKLKQNGSDVLHGSIKEVSLVLAGANPGAYIDQTSFSHSDDGEIDEAIIYTDEFIQNGGEAVMEHMDSYGYDIPRILDSFTDEQADLVHGLIAEMFDDEELEHDDLDDDYDYDEYTEEDVLNIFDSLNDEQLGLVEALLEEAAGEAEMAHADYGYYDDDEYAGDYYYDDEYYDDDDDYYDDDATIGEIFDTLNDDQRDVVYYLLGEALDTADEMSHSDEGDGTYMKTNVFDSRGGYSLAHADFDGMREDIITNAKRYGSLKDAAEDVLEHSDQYGIVDNNGISIDILFPDATSITRTPEFIKRRTEWANIFLSRSTHKPFARIKTMFADITEEDARAKGYIKAKQKKDEFFKLAKRVTTPQTIYKRTKFDRDDVIDITDFDIIPWIKSEMRMMLDEEIARAALVGDGRETSDEGKIKDENVRSILNDDDLFTIKYDLDGVSYDTNKGITDEISEKVIDGAILSRPKYEGSGRPVCFIDDNLLAFMLVQKDDIGRRLYKDEKELANLMGVTEVISCPFMAKLERTDKNQKKHNVFAILVNPVDYVFGADKGGSLSMFDDFDINFNQMIYLMETRTSGALVKAHSAIVIESQPNGET